MTPAERNRLLATTLIGAGAGTIGGGLFHHPIAGGILGAGLGGAYGLWNNDRMAMAAAKLPKNKMMAGSTNTLIDKMRKGGVEFDPKVWQDFVDTHHRPPTEYEYKHRINPGGPSSIGANTITKITAMTPFLAWDIRQTTQAAKNANRFMNLYKTNPAVAARWLRRVPKGAAEKMFRYMDTGRIPGAKNLVARITSKFPAVAGNSSKFMRFFGPATGLAFAGYDAKEGWNNPSEGEVIAQHDADIDRVARGDNLADTVFNPYEMGSDYAVDMGRTGAAAANALMDNWGSALAWLPTKDIVRGARAYGGLIAPNASSNKVDRDTNNVMRGLFHDAYLGRTNGRESSGVKTLRNAMEKYTAFVPLRRQFNAAKTPRMRALVLAQFPQKFVQQSGVDLSDVDWDAYAKFHAHALRTQARWQAQARRNGNKNYNYINSNFGFLTR